MGRLDGQGRAGHRRGARARDRPRHRARAGRRGRERGGQRRRARGDGRGARGRGRRALLPRGRVRPGGRSTSSWSGSRAISARWTSSRRTRESRTGSRSRRSRTRRSTGSSRVNLTGAFNVGQASAQAMVRSGRPGRIVFTSSVHVQMPFATMAVYGATKQGVRALCEAMAIELAPHGIRVNHIGPGWVLSALNDPSPAVADRRSSRSRWRRSRSNSGPPTRASWAGRSSTWPPPTATTSPASTCAWTAGSSSGRSRERRLRRGPVEARRSPFLELEQSDWDAMVAEMRSAFLGARDYAREAAGRTDRLRLRRRRGAADRRRHAGRRGRRVPDDRGTGGGRRARRAGDHRERRRAGTRAGRAGRRRSGRRSSSPTTPAE